MRIALVSPPSHFEPGEPAPSLALAMLAAVCCRAGAEPVCIDANLLDGFRKRPEGVLLAEVAAAVRGYKPDLIALSSWGVSLPFAIVLAEALGRECPEVPIVLGGLRSAREARAALEECPSLAGAVVGEGEAVLRALIEAIRSGTGVDGVPGLMRHAESSASADARRAPLAEWGRAEYGYFSRGLGRKFIVEGTRGCAFRCCFCSEGRQEVRRRAPEAVAGDFAKLETEHGANFVLLADNFVSLKNGWTEALCGALAQHGSLVQWTCSTRADTVSARVVRKLARAGCKGVFLGVESGSAFTLGNMGKTGSASRYLMDVREACAALLGAGIEVKASTIVGFPDEGMDDIEKTVELVLSLQAMGVEAYTGPLVAYPGSPLWDDCAARGLPLRRIRRTGICRNQAGFFVDRFSHRPELAPNQYLPGHRFLSQDRLEEAILMAVEATGRGQRGRA